MIEQKIFKTHKCDERYKIRIGPGNSEKYFQCRKLHAVRYIPDQT